MASLYKKGELIRDHDGQKKKLAAAQKNLAAAKAPQGAATKATAEDAKAKN